MRVLNKRKDKSTDSIYIGRPSKWGNPFEIGKHGTRDDVVGKFEKYLLKNAALMSSLHQIHGHDLMCWCSPEQCHGDILNYYANTGMLAIAKFSEETVANLTNWLKQNQVPNAVLPEKLHVTIVLDKRCHFYYQPESFNLTINDYELDLLGEQHNFLVLKFRESYLEKKHAEAREFNAISWDFHTYQPHVTLSKNCVSTDFAKPTFPLVLTHDVVKKF